jgi:hypothetical protein
VTKSGSWLSRLTRKSSDVVGPPATEALVSALHTRAAMLDDVDVFMFGVRHRKAAAFGPEELTLAIGRMPSVFFPDQDNIYQVTFMGKDPEGVAPEDLFAAWTIAGYQTFTRNGERSYSKGLLNLYEVPAAVESCLSVLVEMYGLRSNWLVQALGDKSLGELFTKSLQAADRRGFDFRI